MLIESVVEAGVQRHGAAFRTKYIQDERDPLTRSRRLSPVINSHAVNMDPQSCCAPQALLFELYILYLRNGYELLYSTSSTSSRTSRIKDPESDPSLLLMR